MNVAAFILACLAIFFFLLDAFGARITRSLTYTPLALALFAAAYTAQLTWETVHVVRFH